MIELYNEDCLEGMKRLEDGSISQKRIDEAQNLREQSLFNVGVAT